MIGEPSALTEETVRTAADALVRYRFTPWRYGDSVGFEGLVVASEMLDDSQYLAWAHGVLRGWAADRTEFRELDNTVPGHALCLIFEKTGDDALVEAAVRVADYLRSRRRIGGVFTSWARAPLRPPSGGRPLPADEAALLVEPGPGIFVDCLHFDPPFFAHLGHLIGDDSLLDEAVSQALAYAALLQDDSGLFYHFWLERTQKAYGPGWGRGQGWAMLGLLDVLTYLPSNHDGREPLLHCVRTLARALVDRQGETGAWPSVLTDPRSPTEASTAAFVAAGLAQGILTGVLDTDMGDNAVAAWQATRGCVERGLLQGVSGAIWPCTSAEHYRYGPLGFVVPWGQGPLLLAARNMAKLLADFHAPGAGPRPSGFEDLSSPQSDDPHAFVGERKASHDVD